VIHLHLFAALGHLGRKEVVLATLAFGAAAVTAGATFAEEHIALVIALAGITVAIVACVAWIDARIERKLKDHTVLEQAWREADKAEAIARHRVTKEKLHALHETVAMALHLPRPNPMEDTKP
jgi:hypothetical protein